VSVSSVRRDHGFFLNISRFLGQDFLVNAQIKKDQSGNPKQE